MKKSLIQLQIPNPCEEEWNNMKTCSNNVKYCSSCSQNIHDFTSMTDDEILAFLNKNNGGICGRFHNSQLNRVLSSTETTSSRFSFSKILAGLIFLGLSEKIQSQTLPVKEDTIQVLEKNNSNLSFTILKGFVFDKASNIECIGAMIFEKNSRTGVQTNIDGYFEMKIPSNINSYKIEIKNTGYNNLYAVIENKVCNDTLHFFLEAYQLTNEPIKPVQFQKDKTLGYVVRLDVKPEDKKKWWQFWKRR